MCVASAERNIHVKSIQPIKFERKFTRQIPELQRHIYIRGCASAVVNNHVKSIQPIKFIKRSFIDKYRTNMSYYR